jgi:hypothetical protein
MLETLYVVAAPMGVYVVGGTPSARSVEWRKTCTSIKLVLEGRSFVWILKGQACSIFPGLLSGDAWLKKIEVSFVLRRLTGR